MDPWQGLGSSFDRRDYFGDLLRVILATADERDTLGTVVAKYHSFDEGRIDGGLGAPSDNDGGEGATARAALIGIEFSGRHRRQDMRHI